MSRPLRCLNSPLRTLSCQRGARVAPHRAKQVRGYAAFAMKTRQDDGQRPNLSSGVSRQQQGENHRDEAVTGSSSLGNELSRVERAVEGQESWNGDRQTWKEAHPKHSEHLGALFPTLSFPSTLASRILTHSSHPAAIHGHNAHYSFMGRRVLESYLLLMLTSSSALKPSHDLDALVSRTLNSYVVGRHVGSKWGLGRALRWTPTVSQERLRPGQDQTELLRSVGLYKIQGEAVSAVIGGIFHQFGGSVAHRVFHTRLLPNLIRLPSPADGLPESFSEDVLAACERLGGPDAPLLVRGDTASSSNQASP